MQKPAKQGTLREVSHNRITINIEDLNLQVVNDKRITIDVPTAPLPPLLHTEAREALVHHGLTPLEVNIIADQLYEDIQKRLLAKFLASRIVNLGS